MLKWANREIGIYPDLVAEYNDRYKLTIISYKILFGAETISAKDFNIYLRGLRLDVSTTFDFDNISSTVTSLFSTRLKLVRSIFGA